MFEDAWNHKPMIFTGISGIEQPQTPPGFQTERSHNYLETPQVIDVFW